MNIYLAIITTVLVLTQIIRLLQNTAQLGHLKQTHMKNKTIENEWVAMSLKLDEIIQLLKEEEDN